MGKTIYAYVVADLIHIGHVLHLENCKKFGDTLVVGVLTDEACMEKKAKPIIPFSERMKMVSALKCVDVVIPQNTYSPIKNLQIIKPDFLMESTSHSEEDLKETMDVAFELEIAVLKMPYYDAQSSTKIKEKIKCQ